MPDDSWIPAPRQRAGASPSAWDTHTDVSVGPAWGQAAPQPPTPVDGGYPTAGGWPTTPAAPAAESPADPDALLNDLFGDDPVVVVAPPPAVEQTVDVTDGDLDDLFGDGTTPDVSDASTPVQGAAVATPAPVEDVAEALNDLDLFADDAAPDTAEVSDTAAPDGPAPDPAAEPDESSAPTVTDPWATVPLPPPGPEAAGDADPASAVEYPERSMEELIRLAAAPAPKATAMETPPAAPVIAPAPAVEAADAAAVTRPKLGLESRRLMAEAAASPTQDVALQAEMHRLQQMVAVSDTVWSNVDRILGAVSANHEVLAVVNKFTLTRDRFVDSEQRRKFQESVAYYLSGSEVRIGNPLEMEQTFNLAYDELIGISVLGPLWRDDRITEIMVDGWDKVVIEIDGKLATTPIRFRDQGHAQRTARELAAKLSDRALTPSNPLVTAQLPGARVNFAIGSIVRSGLSISLRKFRDMFGIEKLIEFGAMNEEMAEFLRQTVVARATVLVSGGTGTGKTTQINALSGWIPDSERVVTIEDAFELQLSNANVVSMQTKEKASADDEVLVTQEMLLVNALRMRPDRIIVGEIREGRGAYVMLQAANTGHDGTMTTIHAQDPGVALNERLADLVLEVTSSTSDVVRRTVARAIDLVVQVTRRRGRRFISEIAVVDRSCYDDASRAIKPEPVFVGDVDSNGNVTFRHVGGVRPDTALGMKLVEAGFDVDVWEPTR